MDGAAWGFVTRAFESMLVESSANNLTSLHSAIQSYLDGIKEEKQQSSSAHVANAPKSEYGYDYGNDEGVDKKKVETKHTFEEVEAGLVLSTLRLAFETQNITVVELALDCLHKLIAYDHLEGDPGLEGGKNAALFADIMSMVCGCVDSSSSDSTVLQVLKVFLTAVTSVKFRVHAEPLIGVVRACYDVAVNSKNPINQATSKAVLAQMITIIFCRMESDPNVIHASKEFQDYCSTGFDAHTGDASFSSPKDQSEKKIALGDALSKNLITDASLASVEELQNLEGGADTKGLEATLHKAVHLENGDKIKQGLDLESTSIGYRDALLLFRTICKMGMKRDNDEIVTTTSVLLSLELLQGLLEGVSEAFTKNFQFIDSVKAYLSDTLLRASVSSSPVIIQHAAGVFTVLLLRFRESLKSEIGIFFPLIVLRYLDNGDCPTNQRLSLLRMLEKVCKDPQILVDIFVNYDCDPDAPNHFRQMATTLSKIAKGILALDPTPQSVPVKVSALQCLVNVLQSLIDWEKSHKESDQKIKDENSFDGCSGKDAVEIEHREDTSSVFEKAKAHKSTVKSAITQLNQQPSKGVEYPISSKLVENSCASVADFLKNTSNLNKTMIGDFLGPHEEFSLSAMHAYVDSMNFSGMAFADAVREFLSGFRLPGDAQKIDSIMEKFAERYCADNPIVFKNADTAYVLAYAVIMLNTNAHNPMVLAKLSKADFVRLNSMAEAEDTPPQELLEIYDSILKEEIKMEVDLNVIREPTRQNPKTEEKGSLLSILNLGLPRSKPPSETISEIDDIVKQTKAILRTKGTQWGAFYTSHRIELIKPMIEAVGWHMLAAFSVIMEEGDYKSRIQLCMEGFKAGIHITHVLEMDTMRNAFLTSLVRSTLFHSPKEMRSKNVEALRTLLSLAESDVDALEDSWNAVLGCISQIEFITLNPDVAMTEIQALNQISRDVFLQSLRQLAGKPTEQVFLNSVKLPGDAVVEFFTALCNVSAVELKQNPARVYSLYKLVEISFFNMARIRMVWARIWSVLASHLIFVGSHHDEKVAMYAIDSLWRLGMKYLERAELANFTFQNDILKPFVVLLRNNQSESMRRFVVNCMVQMIKSKLGRIKSGWRSVFMFFTVAAVDESELIVKRAFELMEQVIMEHFEQVVGICFMEYVKCLIGFANSKSSHQISLKAIALLRICEDRLAEGLVPGGAVKPIDISPEENFDVTEQYWLLMLVGLSDLTSDPRVEVRNRALEVLFVLLNRRGSKFSPSFWESIFLRVLFPIFDRVRHAGQETSVISSDDVWLHKTSSHSLQLLCNLFNTYYNEVSFMLPSLLSLLLDCVKTSDQSVVSIALGALVHLIEASGLQFSDNDWDNLLKSIRDSSYTTLPLELLNNVGFQHPTTPRSQGNSKISEGLSSPSQKPTNSEDLQRSQSLSQRTIGNVFPVQSQTQGTVEFDSKEEVESQLLAIVKGKCSTQLLLLGAIDSIQKKYWLQLKAQQKVTMMEILLSMLDFAASYNSCNNLRLRMRYISSDRPPLNLLQQEFVGTCVYLDILLKITSELEISKENNSELSEFPDSNTTPTNNHQSTVAYSSEEEQLERVAEEKLVSFCGHVLKEASEFQSAVGGTHNREIHRVLELRSPIIVKVIKGVAAMNSHLFKKHIKEFHPSLTKLVSYDQMDVRGALDELFKRQLSILTP